MDIPVGETPTFRLPEPLKPAGQFCPLSRAKYRRPASTWLLSVVLMLGFGV